MPAITSADMRSPVRVDITPEHVARVELADHGAGAGLVGHRDFGVAADQDAHVFALVAGLEDRLVAFGNVVSCDWATTGRPLSAEKFSKRRTSSRKNFSGQLHSWSDSCDDG